MGFSISLPVPGSQKAFSAHPCSIGTRPRACQIRLGNECRMSATIDSPNPLCRGVGESRLTHSFQQKFIILMSFHNSDLILTESHHLDVIPSFCTHFNRITSFGCHFIILYIGCIFHNTLQL